MSSLNNNNISNLPHQLINNTTTAAATTMKPNVMLSNNGGNILHNMQPPPTTLNYTTQHQQQQQQRPNLVLKYKNTQNTSSLNNNTSSISIETTTVEEYLLQQKQQQQQQEKRTTIINDKQKEEATPQSKLIEKKSPTPSSQQAVVVPAVPVVHSRLYEEMGKILSCWYANCLSLKADAVNPNASWKRSKKFFNTDDKNKGEWICVKCSKKEENEQLLNNKTKELSQQTTKVIGSPIVIDLVSSDDDDEGGVGGDKKEAPKKNIILIKEKEEKKKTYSSATAALVLAQAGGVKEKEEKKKINSVVAQAGGGVTKAIGSLDGNFYIVPDEAKKVVPKIATTTTTTAAAPKSAQTYAAAVVVNKNVNKTASAVQPRNILLAKTDTANAATTATIITNPLAKITATTAVEQTCININSQQLQQQQRQQQQQQQQQQQATNTPKKQNQVSQRELHALLDDVLASAHEVDFSELKPRKRAEPERLTFSEIVQVKTKKHKSFHHNEERKKHATSNNGGDSMKTQEPDPIQIDPNWPKWRKTWERERIKQRLLAFNDTLDIGDVEISGDMTCPRFCSVIELCPKKSEFALNEPPPPTKARKNENENENIHKIISLNKTRQRPAFIRKVNLAQLLEEKLVEPGQGVFTMTYQSKQYKADVNIKGKIFWKGQFFLEPAAFSLAVKRTTNPKMMFSDPWKAPGGIQYNGDFIDVLREKYFKKTKQHEFLGLETRPLAVRAKTKATTLNVPGGKKSVPNPMGRAPTPPLLSKIARKTSSHGPSEDNNLRTQQKHQATHHSKKLPTMAVIPPGGIMISNSKSTRSKESLERVDSESKEAEPHDNAKSTSESSDSESESESLSSDHGMDNNNDNSMLNGGANDLKSMPQGGFNIDNVVVDDFMTTVEAVDIAINHRNGSLIDGLTRKRRTKTERGGAFDEKRNNVRPKGNYKQWLGLQQSKLGLPEEEELV